LYIPKKKLSDKKKICYNLKREEGTVAGFYLRPSLYDKFYGNERMISNFQTPTVNNVQINSYLTT